MTIKKRPITTWDQVPVVMDTKYAAMLLGITPNKVMEFARTGKLPGIKPGRRAWRFEKTALMRALGVKSDDDQGK